MIKTVFAYLVVFLVGFIVGYYSDDIFPDWDY